MTYSITDLIGNIGVAMIVFAYFRLQIGRWGFHDLVYLLFNLFGSILITISLVFDFNLSTMILQIFWIVISLIGLGHLYRNRHRMEAGR
ncbi:permease [Thioalkalivibrio denitrificans]|uniref:Permease n=1 Tax=Thioalkalivibrio denitrificans TaxID=108003 RepID=A0A1V3NGC3_9GAMM|nr:permease [Thioalkalivibrio denitrificans]OOG24044.1 permease [Thioalkalivibrio denitrificans]